MSCSLRNDRPFEDSLSALALAAMRESGASGFAYFRYTEDGQLLRFGEVGTSIGEPSFPEVSDLMTASFPLRHDGVPDGVLAFRFSTREAFDAARHRLNCFVTIIRKLWEAQSIPRTYRETMDCIIDMEMKLADSKITSHVRGVLDDESGTVSLESLVRHVETVLRPSVTMRALTEMQRDLHEKVEERNWTIQAKSILQNSRGMTEEEAYSHLRRFSRQSRKRFADVARLVVEGKL